jgi:hypothetical protein
MAGGADFGTARRRGALRITDKSICLTGEEHAYPGVAALGEQTGRSQAAR